MERDASRGSPRATVMDDVRRRAQQATCGHCGRAGDPLYGIPKLLPKAAGDLDLRDWQRLAAGLRGRAPQGQVTAARQLKRARPHTAAATSRPPATPSTPGPLRRRRRDAPFRRTLRRRQDEVLAYFTTGGASNGRTKTVTR